METYFFSGNYLLSIGQPFVILSIKEVEKYFTGEVIILFETFDKKVIFSMYELRYTKVSNVTLEYFKDFLFETGKNEIFFDIIYENFREKLEKEGFNINVELIPTKNIVLSLIKEKFTTQFNIIKERTQSAELKELISLYDKIEIKKTDLNAD